jgi:uncharacterized repeat protein (TIGR03803 family)
MTGIVHSTMSLVTGFALLFPSVGSAADGSSLEVLHAFVRPPSSPRGELVRGADGGFYGTTHWGGAFAQGALFRLDASGKFELLHSFDSSVDGSYPDSALVLGDDRALYGVTPEGGAFGDGTLFKLDRGGRFFLLHNFQGPYDGSAPAAALARGSDGALYGSTSSGGPFGDGTLFKLDASGRFEVLHVFQAAVDGASARTRLVRASDGALYGTTPAGGLAGGTIFKLEADRFVLLHRFVPGVDGAIPDAELTEARDGAVYGTTTWGGLHGFGGLFRIDAEGGFSVLHDFDYGLDGAYPRAPLRVGADGALYGTALLGGPSGYGTLFKLDTSGGFAVLRAFAGTPDGAHPSIPLILGHGGALYGSTGAGGTFDHGMLFKLDASDGFTSLHSFRGGSDGRGPIIPLAAGDDGSLYGVAATGGQANSGAVFRIGEDDTFSSLGWFEPDGLEPASPLLLGRDGALYGTTSEGGRYGSGTLFKLDPDLGLKLLHSFSYTRDGANPRSTRLVRGRGTVLLGTTPRGGPLEGGTVFKFHERTGLKLLHGFAGSGAGNSAAIPLTRGRDGAFYGTTRNGGAFDHGTVFRIDERGRYGILHSFSEATDGANPEAPLVWGRDRGLYGSTWGGGAFGIGTLFKITPAGAFTQLHSFGFWVDGDRPEKPLALGRDGALYGASSGGGAFWSGTLYRIDAKGKFSVLHDFDHDVDGAYPSAPLVKARDGLLYGSTLVGGARGGGTLFRFNVDGRFELLRHLDRAHDGSFPSALIQARDGALYGTTNSGGAFDSGTVFRLDERAGFELLHSFDARVDGTGLSSVPLALGRDGALYGVGSGGPGGGGVIYRVPVRRSHKHHRG